MPDEATADLEFAEVAVSGAPLPQRAKALLGALLRLVPFDSAWVGLADPHRDDSTSLAGIDPDEATLDDLGGPVTMHDIEVTRTHRAAPPGIPSDLPYPAAALPPWAECLAPAGHQEALAVALFAPGGRHVGFVALLSGSPEPPPRDKRRVLRRLAPLLARAVDPMGPLLAVARLVQGATAGVVLREDGASEGLPGLAGHPLLEPDSLALAAAREALDARRVYTSFLWPLGGPHAPDGHARITALAGTDGLHGVLAGLVLVSPPGDLRGLTARELQVLGLLIDGLSNREIARALVVAQRTVAGHLEHILAKMSVPTRTLAAVRAERQGLYVPRPCHGRGVLTAPVQGRG